MPLQKLKRLKSLRSHYTICVRILNQHMPASSFHVDVMLLKSRGRKVTHTHPSTMERVAGRCIQLLQTDYHKRSPVDGMRVFNPQFFFGVDEALS